jgi:hypothetical protein
MMNYEISLVNANYSEESATLARTLLPFIDKVSDFGFLGPDTSFISGRFLASLALHIKDVQCSVSAGFISFALHVNPSALKSIISKGENVIALREALLQRGFQQAAVNIISHFPAKFLWPGLLAFWRDKSPDSVTSSAEILGRMDVLTDPGEQMDRLMVVLA